MLTLEQKWDRRAREWHSHVTSAVGFVQVRESLLRLSAPGPTDACVDLGAGTGFVTTALAAALAAKGPGGWWRIAKNLARYGLGIGREHPATPEFWASALRDAGLADVVFQPVVAEAGVVRGIRPVILRRARHCPFRIMKDLSIP